MHLIIGHKITELCLVGTDPEIQAIIFVELIFQRESADWAAQIKQIHHLHIQFLAMRKFEIPDELHKKSGGPHLWCGNIDPVFVRVIAT